MGIARDKLSPGERQQIAGDLFHVTGHDSGKGELHGRCPFHEEENPSFSYNYLKDSYHCFACNKSGDLVSLWANRHGTGDPKEDFRTFCRRFGINQEDMQRSAKQPRGEKETKKVTRRELEEALKIMPPLPGAWVRRLEKLRGWSAAVMQRLQLRLQTCYRDKATGKLVKIKRPERVAIPVFDRDGIIRNIRIYRPGASRMKIISWGPGCGQSRLFPPAPPCADGPVILCEGEQDTICALSRGLCGITQTSKTKTWKKDHLEPFRGRDVVIAYDADQAGQKYAVFAARSLTRVAGSVKLLEWPDFMGRRDDGTWPENHGQDLTDFFVKHKKTVHDFMELVEKARPWEAQSDRETRALDFFDYTVGGRFAFKPRLLAERILEDLELLFDPQTGLIYKWNGRFWELFQEEHVEKLCLQYLGEEAQQSRARDAAWQARVLSTIPHGRQVNDRPDWVCLKNGMLNLRTLELAPHDKDFYCTYELGVSFDPSSGEVCHRWIAFLEASVQTPEAIMQLQEFFGYCLTRDTRFEKCLLLIGPGADGKSTFLKILRRMVGAENCSAISFEDLSDQFLRASLYGKLLNISGEVGARVLESEYFKRIVSGDPIQGAFKHKDSFEFVPYCKLAFATNKLPRVLDNTDGYFRRLLPVRFKRQFLPGDPDRDDYLEEKLTAELTEIFHWALVGLRRLWEQGGFTQCGETDELMREYRRLNNPVICFIEDCCILDDDSYIGKEELYRHYRNYCNESGYAPHHKENFLRELYAAKNHIRAYRPRIDGKRVWCVKGISVNAEFNN